MTKFSLFNKTGLQSDDLCAQRRGIECHVIEVPEHLVQGQKYGEHNKIRTY